MEKNIILVLNCGSSSIKFTAIDPKHNLTFLSGIIQEIGSVDATISIKDNEQKKHTDRLPEIDYRSALKKISEEVIADKNISDKIIGIGHRIVHGGEKFFESVLITEKVLKKIKDCIPLAPLHNPAHVLGIEQMSKDFPEIKQVAVFDTAFHQTMPEHSYIYPIPYKLYSENKIRRYGAHGTSHRFVSSKAIAALKKDPNDCKLITAHLGNGCSACAILNGKSVDTSMGLTPLEGLMMGTRSGDVDPSLHLYLVENLGYNIKEVTNILNKKSGLLGISETASDMRTIEKNSKTGDKKSQLALDIFCYRLAKYIAALTVPLQGIDGLIFAGGIGENSTVVREKTLGLLKHLHFILDPKHNDNHGKKNNGIITTESSNIAMVIPTDEELLIARDTSALINPLQN